MTRTHSSIFRQRRLNVGALALCALGVCVLAQGFLEPLLSQQLARRAGAVRDEAALERRQKALRQILLSRTRNIASLELGEGGSGGTDHDVGTVRLHTGKVRSESPDFEHLQALAPGDVQILTLAAASKMTTEHNLTFGDKTLTKGNLARGYPGTYSLWLRRTDDGWRLVFNSEADIWGTQRDPAKDVLEVPLKHTLLDDSASSFTPTIEQLGESGSLAATLELRWGRHQWTTIFKASQP